MAKVQVKQYRIDDGTGKENIVEAKTAWAALGIHRKRGPFGLGRNWEFTRQPNGWIVAINQGDKTAEKRMAKLREVNYTRDMVRV